MRKMFVLLIDIGALNENLFYKRKDDKGKDSKLGCIYFSPSCYLCNCHPLLVRELYGCIWDLEPRKSLCSV